MKIHLLKTLPRYFGAITNGEKNFEIRKDDRGFAVGDILILKEFLHDGEFTGKKQAKQICYILRNVPEYGLQDGFAILGLKNVNINEIGVDELEEIHYLLS